jgi:hypothetical protein
MDGDALEKVGVLRNDSLQRVEIPLQNGRRRLEGGTVVTAMSALLVR